MLITDADLKRLLTIPEKHVILRDDLRKEMGEMMEDLRAAGMYNDSSLRGGLLAYACRATDIGNLPHRDAAPLLRKFGNTVIKISVSVEKWDATETPVTIPCEECGAQAVYLVQPLGSSETLHCCAPCASRWVGSAIVGLPEVSRG